MVLKSLYKNNPATIRWESDGDQEIAIRRSSYAVVDNFIIDGAMEGIRLEESDHIIICNNEAHRAGITGIAVKYSSKRVYIIENKIYDTGKIQPQYGEGKIKVSETLGVRATNPRNNPNQTQSWY